MAFDSSFALQEAIELHNQGAVVEARDRYAEIIRREPRNIDALYLSGLAQCHLGEFKDAIKHLRRTVTIAPAYAAAHNTLSMALRQVGRIEDALTSCNAAIASDPSSAEAHANRGDILQDLQRPQEALDAYNNALLLMPDLVPALINSGSLLQDLGRSEEAIANYDRAIALAPQLAEAWLNRSKALHVLGRFEDALSSCDRAIEAQPDFPPAFLARAVLLADRQDFDAALSYLDHALALHPAWPEAQLERISILHKKGDTPTALANCEQLIKADPSWFPAHQLHARLLQESSRLDDAMASIERALALKPDFADGHAWRGAILIKLNRPGDAIAALDRALSIAPDLGTAHVDRGLALHALGRYTEAFPALERGCHFASSDPHVEFVVGLTDLMHGRWDEGLRKFERRLEVPGFNVLHRHFLLSDSDIDQRFAVARKAPELPPFPRWQGEATDGAAILLETEQGIGDAIQFAGFAARLARLGHRVQILTLPILAPLLRTVPGVETVLADADAAERLDPQYWLPLMSVPHVLKTRHDDIGFETPHLSAEPARAASWKARLGSEGPRIGIAWQGNRENWLDAGRSIPLSAFAPIADVPGARLISLQKRPGAEQIDQVPFHDRIERVLDEADKSADALLETAAVIANLDMVVTSDSMIAHLAGALGCPTLIALRRVPDWRWFVDREDSPFYPSARLFRQTVEGDWTPVFARIADAVRAITAAKTGS